MGPAVRTGDIPEDGIVTMLAEFEELMTTGVLRFDAAAVSGEVALVCGQIANDQLERPDGEDPVELLLELREGRYQLLQRLPALPVSSGDDSSRRGSLEVHVAADLMNYCERAGLTGLLTLVADSQRAEVVYDKGELTGIRLDGPEDLSDVFGWEDGSFLVETHAEPVDLTAEVEEEPLPAVPSERPVAPRPDSTGQHFLRVVEVALQEIVKDREERRPASRTSPPLPPMSKPLEGDTLPPKGRGQRPPRKDATVRVIYLGGRDPEPQLEQPSTTRHVRGDMTAEVIFADAVPERTSQDDAGDVPMSQEEPAPVDPMAAMAAAAAKKGPQEETSLLGTFAWVGVALLLALAALALLSVLPALE